MGKKSIMNILHLETALEWRGGQQQIAYLVRGLVQNSIPTTLLCPPNSELYRRFVQQKLPVQAFNPRHHLNVAAAVRIARFIKERQFDILHAHSSHALSLGLLVKLMVPSLKLVVSRRVDFSVKKRIVGVFQYNNHLLDRIICISQNIANVLRKDGVDESKLTIIHSGIDLQRLQCKGEKDFKTLKKTLHIPENYFVVGTVAALVGHKDYPTLLQAAARVCQKFNQVVFCAVGEGEDRAPLERLQQKLGLKHCFKFLGFQHDLGPFYQMFDVFVLASHKEGLGTSVLDAQSCGLPIIATRAGGIPEMIRHLQNGYLVPPKDPEALADGILELIHKPQLRAKLAANALESVARFSIENTVQQHIDLYRSLLANSDRQ